VVAVALFAVLGGPLGLGRALAAQDLTTMTNTDRVSQALKVLATASDLQSVAQQRADEMARTGKLAHTVNLGSKVTGWQRLGENVGRGPNLSDIEAAFMNSPSHRQNILDRAFTQVGVGVTFDGKQYFYVAVIFRQPTGTAAATQPAPAPRAASAPKAKPATTTTRAPAPTTTTAAPTTTTSTPPPPPAPPAEVAAPPVETPPAPVETTTTTAPRPITKNLDFLAANFSGPAVAAPLPAHHLSAGAVLLASTFGFSAGAGGAYTVLRRRIRRPKTAA
jgi:hypothetical protein